MTISLSRSIRELIDDFIRIAEGGTRVWTYLWNSCGSDFSIIRKSLDSNRGMSVLYSADLSIIAEYAIYASEDREERVRERKLARGLLEQLKVIKPLSQNAVALYKSKNSLPLDPSSLAFQIELINRRSSRVLYIYRLKIKTEYIIKMQNSRPVCLVCIEVKNISMQTKKQRRGCTHTHIYI